MPIVAIGKDGLDPYWASRGLLYVVTSEGVTYRNSADGWRGVVNAGRTSAGTSTGISKASAVARVPSTAISIFAVVALSANTGFDATVLGRTGLVGGNYYGVGLRFPATSSNIFEIFRGNGTSDPSTVFSYQLSTGRHSYAVTSTNNGAFNPSLYFDGAAASIGGSYHSGYTWAVLDDLLEVGTSTGGFGGDALPGSVEIGAVFDGELSASDVALLHANPSSLLAE